MGYDGKGAEMADGRSRGIGHRVNNCATKLEPLPTRKHSDNQSLLTGPLRYLQLIIGYSQGCRWLKASPIGPDVVGRTDNAPVLSWWRRVCCLYYPHLLQREAIFIQGFYTLVKGEAAPAILGGSNQGFNDYPAPVDLAGNRGCPGRQRLNNLPAITGRGIGNRAYLLARGEVRGNSKP